MSTDMPPPSLVLPRRTGGLRRAAGDAGVQKTNDDAQATKISCAQLGYFKDDLLPLLAKCLPSRKSPLINRGTWARHAAMRQVTTDFVAACSQHAQMQQQSPQHQQSPQQQQQGGYSSAPAHEGHHPQQQIQQHLGSGSSTASQEAYSSQQQQQHDVFSQPVCQVVVLGAGSDSSWFNLQQQGWPLLSAVHYMEIDYQEVVSKKARTILTTDRLLQLLPEGTTATTAPPPTAAAAATAAAGDSNAHHNAAASHSTWTKQPAPWQQQQQGQADTAGTAALPDNAAQQQQQQEVAAAAAVPPSAVSNHVQELYSPLYSLVSADIRNSQLFEAALQRAGFNARLPTLYMSECVLIYLEPSEAQQVLAAAAARTRAAGSSAAVVIYEQTRPDDAFGTTMISNLEARGCPLRSVTAVPTPASQEQRLTNTGWDTAAAADMAAVYYGDSSSSGGSGWLQPEWQRERRRIERLELLDELEEWKLLQEHYVLVLGVVGNDSGWLSEALQLQQLKALSTPQES